MQNPNNAKYDFMMNPGSNRRQPMGVGGGDKRRLALGIAFVVAVLIVVWIVVSIIFTPDNSGNERLVSLEARQVEIDRIITLGQKNLSNSDIKKQPGTYQTTLLSDRAQLVTLLNARQYEPLKGSLNEFKDSSVDSALSDALRIDNHDDELINAIDEMTSGYYDSLIEARDSASSNKERSILEVAISNVETIYKTN